MAERLLVQVTGGRLLVSVTVETDIGQIKFYLMRQLEQALGQPIHQHLHKSKFLVMQADRLVAYINRCPNCTTRCLLV